MKMTKISRRNTGGFTLLELMIALVILAVLATIAVPNYQSSVRKSKRTQAQTALLELMARQEQYFSENREYTESMADLNWSGNTSVDNPNNDTPGYYNVVMNLEGENDRTVVITATPTGGQAKDSVTEYRLDSIGRKSLTLNGTTEQTGWDK